MTPRWLCRLNLPIIGGHIWDDSTDDGGPTCVRCGARLW